MALTLIEAAKRMSGDDVRAAIIQLYAESSDLLRVIPFDDISGSALKYNHEQTLPGIGFRGLNEGYTESVGVINPVVEPLVIAGGDLDVDKFIVDTMGQDQRSSHEAMKVKNLAHTWTDKFIKGDSASSSKEFDGLQTRLTGDQLIAAGATPNGDALSLAKLDELIDAVDMPTHLMMSKGMRRHLTTAARAQAVGGHVSFDRDELGRQVMTYNDLPILLADRNDQNFATLDFNEACPGGGTNTGTSIYCLSLGDTTLSGIQNGAPDVRDLGELESKPVLRTRVEWYCGIALWHPRAAGRLWGIADAAVVA